MESSYQHGIHASSCSEAVTEAGPRVTSSLPANIETDLYRSRLFMRPVSQHDYQSRPHQLLSQMAEQPHPESSSMQFIPLHSHQAQVHQLFQPSEQPSFTAVQERRQMQQNPTVIDLHQILGLKNQSHHPHESAHYTDQIWTHVLPQNVVHGQQNPPELPPRLLPEGPSVSVDTTCRTGNVCWNDWMSQAYRELQCVKEMHLSVLSMMYTTVCCSRLQSLSNEQTAKLESLKGCVERMVQFLNTPQTEIIRFNKDRFYSSLCQVLKNIEVYKSRGSGSAQSYAESLSQLPFLKQWLQSQSSNPGLSGNTDSLLNQVQEAKTNLQLSKTELDRNIPLARSDMRNTLSSVIGSSGSNSLNTHQQTNFSCATVATNSATSSPELKWQAKKSTRYIQDLKLPTNLPSAEATRHQMLIQRVNEINEKQQFEYSPRPLIPSSFLKVSSRETPPFSLGHAYLKQLHCPFPKGSPSKSVTSPLVIASPSSPAMPSSSPVCLEQYFSPISSFTVRDNSEHPQTPVVKTTEDPQPLLGESSGLSQRFVGVTLTSIENQLLALGTPEKSVLLSPVDLTCPKENQRSSDKEMSTKSLKETVESMSLKALIASMQDIMSVIVLIDTLSGAMITKWSSKVICEDLAAGMFHFSERRNSSLPCKGTTPNVMKRHISSSVPCFSSSCNDNSIDESVSWQASSWELSATSSNKRQRIQAPSFQLSDAVLEEIKQTNQSLIETVVDVASGSKIDVDAGFRGDVIVRCSYKAVGLDHNFEQRGMPFIKLPILLVQLLVPADYPESSPRVLNEYSVSNSEAEETEHLSERAKLMFSLSLRKLSEPFSLRDMAREWDRCARSVLLEFSQRFGGGSFSSKYGSWETCTTAT